jgi:DNA polymerase (family 10)
MLNINEAMATAEATVAVLKDSCVRIEIVGSLRRKKLHVHDVDLVVIPRYVERLRHSLFPESDLVNLLDELFAGFQMSGDAVVKSNGSKLKQLLLGKRNIQVDVYVATPANWATLKLIRTGSKEHNIYLCSLAKRMGMELKADGSGLFRDGQMIAGNSEESIFRALELDFVEPELREALTKPWSA